MMIDWRELIGTEAPPAPADSAGERASAKEAPAVMERRRYDSDMRRCIECANRAESGRCLAALRGEIVASRTYEPIRDMLRRCEGFKPLPDDPDQRPGRARWPGLDRQEGTGNATS